MGILISQYANIFRIFIIRFSGVRDNFSLAGFDQDSAPKGNDYMTIHENNPECYTSVPQRVLIPSVLNLPSNKPSVSQLSAYLAPRRLDPILLPTAPSISGHTVQLSKNRPMSYQISTTNPAKPSPTPGAATHPPVQPLPPSTFTLRAR